MRSFSSLWNTHQRPHVHMSCEVVLPYLKQRGAVLSRHTLERIEAWHCEKDKKGRLLFHLTLYIQEENGGERRR